MMQSLLEGIALRTQEVMVAVNRHSSKGSAISIDGGLAANPYFGQFLCDALDRRVRVATSADLTALGVARMAMIGAGAASLPALPKPAQQYLPLNPLPPNLIARFGIAILRSKGWKGF